MAGNSLGTSYVQVVPKFKDGSLAAMGREVGSSFVSGFGDALKKAAKILATSAIVKGIYDIGRAAVDSYADFEQLAGGVETLFGDSAAQVMQNAQAAFATAGLSANDYMETVTSFSASLLQSLGGDTAEAAQMADMAITDMADNANKMGSDMASIQNAYQGFAKQNYTMLDNLKLGYGGTQAEMQRLLDNAEAITGIHYELGNYADMVAAIHVIQDEMGITGTTAREASETISGSAAAMASAWQNLLTGLSDETQDVGPLMAQLGESVMTYLRNLLPRIAETLGGMSDGIREAFATLGTGLSRAVIHWGPGLVSGVVELVATLAESVVAGIPLVIDAGVTLFGSLLGSLGETVPELVARVAELVPEIATSLLDGSGELLAAAGEFLGTIVAAIPEVAPRIAEALPQLVQVVADAFGEGLADAFAPLGEFLGGQGDAFNGMVERIQGHLSDLAPVLEIIKSDWALFSEALVNLASAVAPLVTEFLAQLGSAIVGLMPIVASIGAAFMEVATVVINAVAFLVTDAQTGFEGLRAMISEKWEAIKAAISEKVEAVRTKVTEVWEGIKASVSGAVEAVRSKVTSTFEAVKGAVTTTWSNIKTAITSPIESAKEAVRNAINAIKGFFSFSVSWPHIPLPHFGISPSGWGVGDLLKGVIPSLSISWYAKGGIIDEPTLRLAGVGERGPELVWPSYEPYLSRYADAIAGSMGRSGGVTNNYYIDGNLVPVDAKVASALETVAEYANSSARMGTTVRR